MCNFSVTRRWHYGWFNPSRTPLSQRSLTDWHLQIRIEKGRCLQGLTEVAQVKCSNGLVNASARRSQNRSMLQLRASMLCGRLTEVAATCDNHKLVVLVPWREDRKTKRFPAHQQMKRQWPIDGQDLVLVSLARTPRDCLPAQPAVLLLPSVLTNALALQRLYVTLIISLLKPLHGGLNALHGHLARVEILTGQSRQRILLHCIQMNCCTGSWMCSMASPPTLARQAGLAVQDFRWIRRGESPCKRAWLETKLQRRPGSGAPGRCSGKPVERGG